MACSLDCGSFGGPLLVNRRRLGEWSPESGLPLLATDIGS